MIRDYKELRWHILYWISFTLFFAVVWGTYDQEYGRNFVVQLFSLPSRLVLVYGTLLFLVPHFFEKDKYALFLLGLFLLLLFCGVFIQRFVMIYIVEGAFLPYKSPVYFRLNELTNTVIDVGIAAIVPLGYYLFTLWRSSKREISQLTESANTVESRGAEFLILKEGNVHHKVRFKEIIYIESLRNYLRIKTTSKDIISYGSLSGMLSSLPASRFLRVQRSFIINVAQLQSYTTRQVVINNTRINIGRKYREEVLQRLENLGSNQYVPSNSDQ